ncbi:interleukin-1 receptor-associated kinase 1-binding protein 1 isoform X2 [Struthio camelus]|uniref:interleukin-1 receptor-associated kinase 1-binding protein 1 isoform X2 n=1 Tax=Struthio camelus TaxID=8801 RepID=UPI00360424BE
MALPASPPARVFAQLGPTAPAPAPALERGGGCGGPPPPREVHVSGSAELSAGPDRARVCVRLGSRKAAAAAARGSVARRLEYIAQSARRRGVPEENMTITEDFSRLENTYQMEAEVCIIFSDFGKMQNVCNLLIEKLGTSVTISPPHFYHSPEAVDTLRSLHRITTGSLPKEEASHDRTRSRSSQSINTEFEMMMIRLWYHGHTVCTPQLIAQSYSACKNAFFTFFAHPTATIFFFFSFKPEFSQDLSSRLHHPVASEVIQT